MKTSFRRLLFALQVFFLLFISKVGVGQVKAEFTASPQKGCPPMVVIFQDQSTGNPNYWKWDLGNGTISFLQNPIATYFNPGKFNIKLLVRNAANDADSVVKSQFIEVYGVPDVKFTSSDTTGCFPKLINFFDNSTAGSGTIASWQWDFGDGTLSSLKNPSHTYTAGGNFNVTLRVVNSLGCSKVVTKNAFIKLAEGVKAGFTYQAAPGCKTPTPVTFTNQTTGTGALTYKWIFGDGNTSTVKDPVHNYITAGSYTVKLIVNNAYGCADSFSVTNAVTIGFVKANFNRPDSVCAGINFTATNTSTPTPPGATWYFGDGTTSTDINPVKSYATPGTYQIKLVSDFGSCSDSIVKSIKVLPKPTGSFTSVNNMACKPPLNVTFTSNAPGATSYSWNFGNGVTSTLANPTVAYNNFGNFDVTLIVRNANGCTDTIVKPQEVKIVPPLINSINGFPVKECLPYTINPVANIASSQPIVSYQWSFGDGGTSILQYPSYTYTTPGEFTVKLVIVTASGCKDSIQLIKMVKVGNKPTTNFTAQPRLVCAFEPINFTDLSTNGPIHDWFWKFGDGTSSILKDPIHSYVDTGKFDVTLIVTSFGCSDTLKILEYVYIKPPIAAFDTAFLCNDPLRRRFVNKSIGAITYKWDFGDGTSDTSKNPIHVYAASGTYRVKLKVKNETCEHETAKDVVVVYNPGVLTLSETVLCREQRVTFNLQSVNNANITKFAWYFEGMPKLSVVTTVNPISSSYSISGNFPAAVVTTNILNCNDTFTINVPVKVYGPKAGFISSVAGTCSGSKVTFTDTTKTDGSHPITNWNWSYGDGTIKNYTTPPFEHMYSGAGSYDVKMVVKDSYGCIDSITRPALINVTSPKVNFTPSDTTLCPNIPLTLQNNSTGSSLTYKWSFGDGNTSVVESPVYNYGMQGSYIVKLVGVDINGCKDSTSKDIKVFLPKANFSVSDSFSSCPPLLVNVTNLSSNYTLLNWDFGNGSTSQLKNPSHMYTYPGTYLLKLVVINTGGCTDTIVKKIVIEGPTGSFAYNPLKICSPGTIDFVATTQNTVNYIWDYADGTTIFSNQTKTSHLFTELGEYIPRIILEDAMGCKVPVVGLDTIKVMGLKTNILAQSTTYCDSGYVAFSDSTITNDGIKSYQWNFGDGKTSTSKNPVHTYTSPGTYKVSLVTTSQFGCTDSANYNQPIKVISSPKIAITGATGACEPAQFAFVGNVWQGDSTALQWTWDFGNGNTGNLQDPGMQAYANAGTYNIKLRVKNSDGCGDSTIRTATVYPSPKVNAGVDTIICKNSSFTLHATGSSFYRWDASPTLSCTACPSPIASPLVATTYYVTGETEYGCTSRDTVSVLVTQKLNMTVGRGDTICVGATVPLTASGSLNYQWSPALYLDNANISSPKSKPDSTIEYRVIGTDDKNCFADTGYIKVKVYKMPVIDIKNDNINLKVGQSIKLETTSSPDITQWKWFPTQGLSCSTCPEPIASPKESITYSVVATNDGRCLSRDQVTITVICNNGNIFVPNTFSPNGDGNNDYFFPRGTGITSIKNMKVFNRWGQVVFEKNNMAVNNANDGWNGIFNGLQMPTDVYVYIMEVVCDNSSIIPVKGNVTLLR